MLQKTWTNENDICQKAALRLKNLSNVIYLINFFNFHLNELNLQIKNLSDSPGQFFRIKNNLENLLFNSERKHDKSRSAKLTNLITEKNITFIKIKLLNWTNEIIPDEVEDILSLGKNLAIGSCTDNTMKIIKELDNLPVYVKFEYEARKAGVSEIDIAGIKSHTVLTGTKLSHC